MLTLLAEFPRVTILLSREMAGEEVAEVAGRSEEAAITNIRGPKDQKSDY